MWIIPKNHPLYSSEVGNTESNNERGNGRPPDEAGGSGVGQANTCRQRLQGRDYEELRECFRKREPWKGNLYESWPARPGEEQREWEHPRTESKLGFTVNGYNLPEEMIINSK